MTLVYLDDTLSAPHRLPLSINGPRFPEWANDLSKALRSWDLASVEKWFDRASWVELDRLLDSLGKDQKAELDRWNLRPFILKRLVTLTSFYSSAIELDVLIRSLRQIDHHIPYDHCGLLRFLLNEKPDLDGYPVLSMSSCYIGAKSLAVILELRDFDRGQLDEALRWVCFLEGKREKNRVVLPRIELLVNAGATAYVDAYLNLQASTADDRDQAIEYLSQRF